MDDGPPVNGGEGAGASSSLTPAQKLQEKHAATIELPHTSVEEVVDEEDLLHPPPSAQTTAKESTEATPVLAPAETPISAKAAGQQNAKEEPDRDGEKPKTKSTTGAALDTKSEEAFPALGGGPKSKHATPVSTAWGTRRPVSSGKAETDGVNGHIRSSSTASSGISTPVSGMLTPSSTNASVAPRGLSAPQHMPIPGRQRESVRFAPSQLKPRDQLRKPLKEILRNVNKRSKATVEMRSAPHGVIVFEGTGPIDPVRQALKEVAMEVGSKQSVKVPIPLSVRPHVIGRQGAVVQGITKRTGAHIQIPKVDEPYPSQADDDDSLTVDVSIEGDAVAAEMARREIEAIVNERTSTVNMRLRDIPPEFFPFIAGPHNSGINALEDGRQLRIQVPQYYTWSSQPPPQVPSSGLPPNFIAHPDHHIRLFGDRLAAQDARAAIERQVEDLRRRITLSQLAINRGQHQFIIGDKGTSLHDLLQETGCAVILPPHSDDTEMLTIVGPQDQIDSGIDKVMNLATSMQMSSVDIARQHANAPLGSQAHARVLTRYLQEREIIQRLERKHDARIVLPTTEDSPMNWEIYSRNGRNTILARSDIMNLVNAHPPSRLRHVEVDPFFHQHLREEIAQHFRQEFGVHILLPEELDQSSQITLVYEGAPTSEPAVQELPRDRPSPTEIAEFEKVLLQAQTHINDLVATQQDIGAASVNVPSKFHAKARKFLTREQSEAKIPVQCIPSGDLVTLRGPLDAVEDLSEKLVAFVEDEKHDELERGHVMSFDFPQKYANILIGRKGENINKYREDFDVDIQVKDGKVEIKGPPAKAETVKSRILALGKKLEDEAIHVLKIQPQYHRDIIGAKGSQVNRLQDRYNVRIQFPRAAIVHDDVSSADAASEAGGTRNSRPNQAADEVLVRGPRKGADEARSEILNLLQWTIDNSYTSTVSVAQSQLPSLIGQGGREMENARLSTGAQIDVPGSRGNVSPSGRVDIHLKGTKKQVEEAKKLLEGRAQTFDDTVKKTIDVDKKYHKALIGAGGSNIRSIVVDAGGSDDRRDLARIVRFPRQDSEESTIRVEALQQVADKIVAAIKAFVGQREGQITEIVEVIPEKHRLLIGRGGEIRRALESEFQVSVDIPKLGQQGLARSQIKIAGQPDNVQKAKAHILSLVKDQEGETIHVPRRHHHAISDNGQFFRSLRNNHKITVDHAGQHLPPKPTARSFHPSVNGDALPLITDDPSAETHNWQLVEADESNLEEGDIPWVLRGSPDNIAKAKAKVEQALEQARSQQQSATGYLVLPDPRSHRFIIGQGGSQINAIRKQTGCKITVPRDQKQGEAIEIVGTKDGVEEARDVILEVVRNGGRRD